MRPRASKVAKTRLVETEEDVETVHEDDGLSVSVHWRVGALALHPSPLSGGRWREQGVGSVSTYPHIKLFIFRHLHIRVGVGRGKNGGDNPLT